MKLLDIEEVKWIEDSFDDVKKLTQGLSESTVTVQDAKNVSVPSDAAADGSAFSKIKSFVRKAVDCCIE